MLRLCLAILLLVTSPLSAQNINPADVITWQAMGSELNATGELKLFIRLTTDGDFSLYRDKVSFKYPLDYKLTHKSTPTPVRIIDPLSGEQVDTFRSGEFELTFTGKHRQAEFPLAITYIACTDKICLFPHTETLNFTIPANALRTDSETPVVKTLPTTSPAPTEQSLKQTLIDQATSSFIWLMLLALLGGLMTNLTPCVLPMLPITLKTLGNQHRSPRISALCYGAGIILAYSVMGLVAAFTGDMFGAILGNIYFTIPFSILLFVLGMSMLGWVDVSILQRLGMRFATRKNSLTNSFSMGLGAGMVAAPCTGPILGMLLAYAATQMSGLESVALFLLYSFGFACPYMFAGSYLAKLAKLQVAARVQLIAKLGIASMVFAVAFYYLRIPFYMQLRHWQEHWLLTAVGLLAVSLPLAYFATSIRYAGAKFLSLVAAILLGASIFAFSQKLTAPPVQTSIVWLTDEQQAVQQARLQNRPLLIDAWAEWCERCKQMDAYTYTDERVAARINAHWVALKIDFTLNSEVNSELRERYGILSLPTTIFLPAADDLNSKTNITGYLNADEMLRLMGRLQP
ncbi:MAG: thioredoxin family protein [Pseudomonadota bacterium]|nr:thioredoxin family protein [Pseudomonadota bacterium]